MNYSNRCFWGLTLFLFVVTMFLVQGCASAEIAQLQVINYSETPVYATAVKVPADEVYNLMGISPSIPLKAVDRQGSDIPLTLEEKGGKKVLCAYLSLKPAERRNLTFTKADRWANPLSSAKFDKASRSGHVSNGLLKLNYTDRRWNLVFDRPWADNMADESKRELVRNCEIDLWLDTTNRGRLLNYTPDDLYKLGLIHTSDARLVDADATVSQDGSATLKLVRKFDGFAKDVLWTQTYTLLEGLPQLMIETSFTVSGESKRYLAYVNQGSGLAGVYGELLKEKPLFKYVDPADPTALIAGGLSSPLLRVAWRSERCWIGFSAPNGAGLGISTTQETRQLDRGSTVWNINRSDFRVTFIEDERKHFPFEFSRENLFVNGLTIVGTSGGVDMWKQSKDLFKAATQNKTLDMMHSYAVFLNGRPLQTGFVKNRLGNENMFLSVPGENKLTAAVKLATGKKYKLNIHSQEADADKPLTITARNFDDGGTIGIIKVEDRRKQNLDFFDELNVKQTPKGHIDLILEIRPASAALSEFSLAQAPPAAPELSTPRDRQDVTDFAVFFRWKKVPGAIDYELQYSKDADFSDPQIRNVRMETELAFYMPKDDELPSPGRWYWRVRVKNGQNNGIWSKTRQMQVNSDRKHKPLQHHITPEKPLFTYEGCRIARRDVANFKELISDELRPYAAYVFTPLEEDDLHPQEKLVEYFSPFKNTDVRFFTRPMHPGTMAEHYGSLSETEALFQQYPNLIGVHSGEAMSALYRGGEVTTFSHRLIKLCAKYGKLFYMADGTYPLDNKWELLYQNSGKFLLDHKGYLAFAQKNNIMQRQFLSQSSALGLYLSDTITNHGAWEDGGWYWQQVGFQNLGELFGRRGGDVRTMPRIFWCLNFVMGISRGTAIFSLDGQTGTALPIRHNVREIDAPLAHNKSSFWTRDGQMLPTYHQFIEPLFNAIIERDLIPTKEQVLDNIRIAIYNDGIEATEDQEPYYRQYQPLYAGTYGFEPMNGYPGELYEFFPNTGRYYYIPALPQGRVSLGSDIKELPLSILMDEENVRNIFNRAYPQWYTGEALVSLVGDTMTILNSNENIDKTQSYEVPFRGRGLFLGIDGEINVHSYLIGKFEQNNKKLWLQINTEYPEREFQFSLTCREKPNFTVKPSSAIQYERWVEGRQKFVVSNAEGVVEIEVKAIESHTSMSDIDDIAGLPRILLLGDSISLGYTPAVRELLKGRANVHRPQANCGSTRVGLREMDKWLGDQQWDVIHFNFGLHDLRYVFDYNLFHDEKGNYPERGEGFPRVPLDEYESNLRQIVSRLKDTGAKLIWCSTTPLAGDLRGYFAGKEVIYNQAALKVMQDNEIQTDDLWTFAKPQLRDIQIPGNNPHFTKKGSAVLARQVVESILKTLK